MWENRSRRLLLSACLASGFLTIQMTIFILKAFFRVKLPYGMIDYCVVFFRYLGFPVSMPLMTLLIGSSLCACLWIAAKHAVFSIRWSKVLNRYADAEHSSRLAGQYGFGTGELSIVRCSVPIAMTIGIAKPRIVISTRLLSLLNRSELDAVMEHERFHLRRKDPMAIFLLSLIRMSFWYIPIFKWLLEKYTLMIEIMADRHAMSSTGNIVDLGGALIKLAKQGPFFKASYSNAFFAETSVNLRIKLILDPHYRPSFKPPLARSVLSMIVFFLIATLA